MSGAIAVYCASSTGTHPAYEASALSIGKALAKASRPLIYGGGRLGLMGSVSQAVLDNGGHVTGISPYAMVAKGKTPSSGLGENKEMAGISVDKVSNREPPPHPNRVNVIVDSMHDRKTEMAKRADGGFVSLPGGYGTFEELLEVTTWAQLAILEKPILIINVLNYYNPLREQIQKGVDAGFIKAENFDLVAFVDGPEDLNQHESFDWGSVVVQLLEEWKPTGWKGFGFDWSKRPDGTTTPLKAT